MANTHTLISSYTVPYSGTPSVTFSSIPSTYTDLKILGSTRCDGASAQLIVKFNGSTTGYSRRVVYGDGSTANSSGGSAEAHVRFAFSETSSQTASTFNSFNLYIPNYTSSNQKSLSADSVSENNATGAEAGLHAGLWSGTAAITSINISDVSATNFVQHSSFYLYGIKNS